MLEDENPGAPLDYWLTKHNVSSRQLADATGIDRTSIVHYRNGQVRPGKGRARLIVRWIQSKNPSMFYKLDDFWDPDRLQKDRISRREDAGK